MDCSQENQAVLHVVVVGFHHKRGCQVDYSYPPLLDSHNSTFVPEEWKNLPFLALPDGAHNYTEDTIYFHLPPLKHYKEQTTVYGVSCYRQISTNLLKKRDDDVTRGTVQKSVVVLSQMPIYGILNAKLQIITQAYFEEKDFSKIEILRELFDHVNHSLNKVGDRQRFMGISPHSIVSKFHHKTVMLFKLLLLERRVLFYTAPVHKLVGGIMALLSLLPDTIDTGLSHCTETYKQHVSIVTQTDLKSNDSNAEEYGLIEENIQETEMIEAEENNIESINSDTIDITVTESENAMDDSFKINVDINKNAEISNSAVNTEGSLTKNNAETDFPNDTEELADITPPQQNVINREKPLSDSYNQDEDSGILLSTLEINDGVESVQRPSTNVWETTSDVAASITARLGSISSSIVTSFAGLASDNAENNMMTEIENDDDIFAADFENSRLEIKSDESPGKSLSPPNESEQQLSSAKGEPNTNSFTSIMKLDQYKSPLRTNGYGLPLSIFTRGHICLPYISLQQYNDITENVERGYLVGATNVLFKTNPTLADVVVDMEDASVEIRDINLRRLLHLSAADLRFADYLVSHVCSQETDVDDMFFSATGWEGGDEWIQAQFLEYILYLLSRSTQVDAHPKDVQDCNDSFLAAWKQTQNYQVWAKGDHPEISKIPPHHPFQAQYAVSDIKLRLHHNLQSSERGRQIEDAMVSANQMVSSTGKAVGSAFVSAKSSMTSWLSNKLKK